MVIDGLPCFSLSTIKYHKKVIVQSIVEPWYAITIMADHGQPW